MRTFRFLGGCILLASGIGGLLTMSYANLEGWGAGAAAAAGMILVVAGVLAVLSGLSKDSIKNFDPQATLTSVRVGERRAAVVGGRGARDGALDVSARYGAKSSRSDHVAHGSWSPRSARPDRSFALFTMQDSAVRDDECLRSWRERPGRRQTAPRPRDRGAVDAGRASPCS